MKNYTFTLIATSEKKLDADEVCNVADCLYDAGAEDCTVSASGSALVIDVDRESLSYRDAVLSAIKQVRSISGLTVKSLDAGQYVGLSDAAEFCHLSRSALSKFSKGERGGGNFPSPCLRVNSKTPLYDWSEIASWLYEKGLLSREHVDNAQFTASINTALQFANNKLKETAALSYELNNAIAP